MTRATPIRFAETDLDAMAAAEGRLAVIVTPDGKLDTAGRRVNRLAKGALVRLTEAERFGKAKAGQVFSLDLPTGLAAETLDVLVLPKNASRIEARKGGAALGRLKGAKALTVMAGTFRNTGELALGIALRDYRFDAHKTGEEAGKPAGEVVICHADPAAAETAAAPLLAIAEGALFTRDLVSEPANVLTTTEFANRLKGLTKLGVEVEIQDMPFDSLIAAVQEGKIDAVIAAMQATAERDKQVDFTIPYRMTKDAFMGAGDSAIVIEKPEDAAGYTIGAQTGTVQEGWIQDTLVAAGLTNADQVFSYERADQAALDVANGRIELLLMDAEPSIALAEQTGLKILLITELTAEGGKSIAIPDGASDLKAELDSIIQGLIDDGTVQQIQEANGLP